MTPWNNLFLMVILIWLQTGFCMVILSSAIKSVPDELLEAARIDGANGVAGVPPDRPALDLVDGGGGVDHHRHHRVEGLRHRVRHDRGSGNTQVVASQMVTEFFDNSNNGIGAALAVVLFIAVVPILVINVKRFRAQEAMR